MTAASPITLTVSRRMPHAPERVYDAWLDPSRAAKFLFSTPEGTMVKAEIDACIGGRYTFTDRRTEGDVEHPGEYLELDRPRCIVFSFSVDGSTPDRVEVDIVPTADGCEVTLTTQMSAEFAEYEERAREGWTGILAGCELAAA